jgi:hypothetical protein
MPHLRAFFARLRLGSMLEDDTLALTLLYERHAMREKSRWAAYLAALPAAYDLPCYWSPQEVDALAGTGLQAIFGGEARGKTADQIDACRGGAMWAELATRSLLRETPVSGATRLKDGSIHYWLRLPLSSNGVEADMVLCHDRYLPAEAAVDPDRAAMRVDLLLRRDREFVPA